MFFKQIRKTLSILLGGALIIGAPGIDPYRLFAANMLKNINKNTSQTPLGSASLQNKAVLSGAPLGNKLSLGTTLSPFPQASPVQAAPDASASNTGLTVTNAAQSQASTADSNGETQAENTDIVLNEQATDETTHGNETAAPQKKLEQGSQEQFEDQPVTGQTMQTAAETIDAIGNDPALIAVTQTGTQAAVQNLYAGKRHFGAIAAAKDDAPRRFPDVDGDSSKHEASEPARSSPGTNLEPAANYPVKKHPKTGIPFLEPNPELGSTSPGFFPNPVRWFAHGIRESFKSYKEFDESERAYIIGQIIWLTALTIYLVSLPALIQSLTGVSELSGIARAVHYSVFAVASLFAGRTVARKGVRATLVSTALIRASLFASIGILVLTQVPSWPGPLLAIIGLNAVVAAINHLVTMDTDGPRHVFSSNKKIESAGYLYDFIFDILMLFIPIGLGFGMDFFNRVLFMGAGPAIGFVAFAGLTVAAAYIFATKVKFRNAPKSREQNLTFFKAVRDHFLNLLKASKKI